MEKLENKVENAKETKKSGKVFKRSWDHWIPVYGLFKGIRDNPNGCSSEYASLMALYHGVISCAAAGVVTYMCTR